MTTASSSRCTECTRNISTKLKTYRDARTAAEDKLKAAREDLKGVTNARQEAMLVLRGLLD